MNRNVLKTILSMRRHFAVNVAENQSLRIRYEFWRRTGRHPRLHFRGLLRLHSRYSLQSRSSTFVDFVMRIQVHSITAAHQLTDLQITIYNSEAGQRPKSV